MAAIQEVRVVLLTDSNVGYKDILGEGGFSALVDVTYDDATHFRILYDTGGSTPALRHNLKVMEEDLTSIDAIILSHGHWDHIGGLMEVLDDVGKKVPIVCHPDVMEPKIFVNDEGKRIPVGIQEYFTPLELKDKAEVIATTDSYQVAQGIITTGEVPRTNDFETLSGNLLDIVTMKEGKESTDQIRDDLSVAFQLADGSVVVLAGCCHSGIANTVDHITELTETTSITGIIGGLHLRDASPERLEKTVSFLNEFPLAVVAPCHCTGLRGRAALMYAFDKKFRDVGAGDVVRFTST